MFFSLKYPHHGGTGLLTLCFTLLLLIRTQAFLDSKLLISDTAEIFHKFPIGLGILSLRVLGSPASVEIYVLNDHWILSSLCFMIGMTLVSLFTLYFTSMIGSVPFAILGL